MPASPLSSPEVARLKVSVRLLKPWVLMAAEVMLPSVPKAEPAMRAPLLPVLTLPALVNVPSPVAKFCCSTTTWACAGPRAMKASRPAAVVRRSQGRR